MTSGPIEPVKEKCAYVCQGCFELVSLAPGGQAYRHEDGRHTHLDPECVEALGERDAQGELPRR